MDPLIRNLILVALVLSLGLMVLANPWTDSFGPAPSSQDVARSLFEDNALTLLFLGLLLATGLVGGVYVAKNEPEVEAPR